MILVLPGNPGLVHFYRTFLVSLYKLFNSSIEVRCVSYAGQIQLSEKVSADEAESESNIYDLKFQVLMMQRYVAQLCEAEPNLQIVLVGHSVGAYVSLQMLDSVPPDCLHSAHFVCPVLHNIAQSPNGRRMSWLLQHTRPVAAFIAYMLSCLPSYLNLLLLHFHLGKTVKIANQDKLKLKADVNLCDGPVDSSGCADIVRAARHLLHSNCTSNCIAMSACEMRTITGLQYEMIARHLESIEIIFARADDWCSPQQQLEIRRAFPSASISMLDEPIMHAFVIGHAPDVARLIAKQIRSHAKQF